MDPALKTMNGDASVEPPDTIATTRVRPEEGQTTAFGARIGRLAADQPPAALVSDTEKRSTAGGQEAEGNESREAVGKPVVDPLNRDASTEDLAGLGAA